MAHTHRRDVLLGLTASVAGLSALTWQCSDAVAQTQPPPGGPLSTKEIKKLLDAHLVPGASLAIIKTGKLDATYTYGFARLRENRPVVPQTRFQAASLSKTVNALGVLRLVQTTDHIKLRDPVNSHLSSFWQLHSIAPDPSLVPKADVTIRMLLSHTGGTNVHGFNPGYENDASSPLPSLQQILDGMPPANSYPIRIVSQPGDYCYSGGGVTVLQQMVIDVTKKTDKDYPSALKRLVLDPLGMSESSFFQPPEPEVTDNAAFGYRRDGSLYPGGFKIYPQMAAAGLWTTARDFSCVLMAIMDSFAGKPGALLEQKLASEMLTPVAVDEHSGLGTFINDDDKDNVVFSHAGGNLGFRSLYIGNLNTQNGMVAMTNGDKGSEVCEGLLQGVRKVYHWS